MDDCLSGSKERTILTDVGRFSVGLEALGADGRRMVVRFVRLVSIKSTVLLISIIN
jgi:hypothetical protein